MKWFGPSPWPSEELRAAVCEDEVDRIPVPVGQECVLCTEDIMQDDRGVSMPHINEDGEIFERYSHLNCLIDNVGGPEWAR